MPLPSPATRSFLRLLLSLAVAGTSSARAAISISGVVDKTKYDNTASFFITAAPNGATTTATLGGVAVAVGTNVTVSAISFHELKCESRAVGGALLDSKVIRFI